MNVIPTSLLSTYVLHCDILKAPNCMQLAHANTKPYLHIHTHTQNHINSERYLIKRTSVHLPHESNSNNKQYSSSSHYHIRHFDSQFSLFRIWNLSTWLNNFLQEIILISGIPMSPYFKCTKYTPIPLSTCRLMCCNMLAMHTDNVPDNKWENCAKKMCHYCSYNSICNSINVCAYGCVQIRSIHATIHSFIYMNVRIEHTPPACKI